MSDQTQNVLVSFTEDEARLLRHTLEAGLARRIRMTAYEAKQERISREAVK